ncbi:hypothetical protein CFIICLFH_4980 [Methylobacterium goesingense]|nr:hypothetical protein CFIICLFH_4980 [Methylobacterium goesingense]
MVAHHAQQIERHRREAGRRHRGGVDRAGLHGRARLHVVLGVGLQAALAGQVRLALAHPVEGAGQDDRREAAQHHRRQHLGEDVALRNAEDAAVADGERDRALADAAGHDRHHDEEEGVVGAEAEERAHQGADAARRQGAEAEGDEDLEEALDQYRPVHPQDAADDDGRDVEVEKVGELGEVRDRLDDRTRDQRVVDQRRGDEGGEDRPRPDLAQDRQALADLRAGEAPQHQDGDHRRCVGLDLALGGQHPEQHHQNQVDRQRDDADLDVDEAPPALRPESPRLGPSPRQVGRRGDRDALGVRRRYGARHERVSRRKPFLPRGAGSALIFGLFSGLNRAERKAGGQHQSGRAGLVN